MRRRDPASVAGASNAATTLGWNGQTAKKRTVSNVTTTATSAPHRRPRGIPACVRRSTPRTKVQAARKKRGPAAAHARRGRSRRRLGENARGERSPHEKGRKKVLGDRLARDPDKERGTSEQHRD